MRHFNTGVCSAIVLSAAAFSATAQPLPTDPSLVTGELENGLRYIVKKHAVPPGRAVVWIHFDTGSLNETDKQRGIAHYLEHMAFNGSENFPPGSVVPLFQSLGMTFGRDQNAFTSFEQTTYQLSLPDTKAETLDKGLKFFADVTHRLALLPHEIEEERGIIQEERRRSLSGRQRVSYSVIERMAPGSIFGQRITIGTEETIGSVKEADFRDYYTKWYGASNATVMVVADAEPAFIIEQIKDKFASAPKKPRPTRQAVNVKAYDKSFAIVASDPEVRSEQIQITRLEPARSPVTTVPQMRADLVMTLAERSLNRRLSDKVARGGTSYLSANVSSGSQSNAIYTAEISGRANPGKWKETLSDIAMELQRARAFGFTAREIDDAKKEMISGAERAVETEATLPAQAIIGRLNGNVADGEPNMSASQRLELLKRLLPEITGDEIARRFSEEFDPRAVAFIATLPSGPGVPTEAELLDLGLKALAVKPTQESEAVHATKLMSELPAPGAVKEMTQHAPTKVWNGWLSNNTRVNYRFMNERKNEVSINISLIGGELLETAANRGITRAAELAWSRQATKRLASTDIRELMTGKKINVRGGGGFGGGGGRGGRGGGGGGGGSGGDSIALNISGSPEDLETGLQLAYLLLTEPKIEQSSFEQFKTTAKQTLQEVAKNPVMFGALKAAALPYPDSEPRTKPMTAEQIDAITLPAAQAWLEKLIKESPIEVSIVGDIEKDEVLDLVARYVGALAPRDRVSAQTYASLRKLERPKGPRVVEETIDTPTPQAFVLSGFYGTDESNTADARALTMATRVLSTRMVKEVREDAQLVYSIGAASRPATTFPGFGVVSAGAPTDPSKVQALVAKLASMYEEFARTGPTDEELVVAKKQMANTLEEQMREPGFWFGRLQEMTFKGSSLDDILTLKEAYQSMTAAQVKDTFAKYYSKDNALTVIVKPAPGAAESVKK